MKRALFVWSLKSIQCLLLGHVGVLSMDLFLAFKQNTMALLLVLNMYMNESPPLCFVETTTHMEGRIPGKPL